MFIHNPQRVPPAPSASQLPPPPTLQPGPPQRTLRTHWPSHSLGSLCAPRDRLAMMGMKMPPARAVDEGMAGAMSASAQASP